MATITIDQFRAALTSPDGRAQLGLGQVDQSTADQVTASSTHLDSWYQSWLAHQPSPTAPAPVPAPVVSAPQPIPVTVPRAHAPSWDAQPAPSPTAAPQPFAAPTVQAAPYGGTPNWGTPVAPPQAPAQQGFGWTPGMQPQAPATPQWTPLAPNGSASGKTWKGTTGLVLSIVGTVLGLFLPIVGVGLGTTALVFALKERGTLPAGAPGRGLATAAMVVAIVAIALSGLSWLGALAMRATPSYGI